jgi:hypothetical protein
MSDLSTNQYAQMLGLTAGAPGSTATGGTAVDPSLLPAGTTGAAPVSQNPLQPGTAESPYTFTSALAGQKVALGQAFSQMLGLPATTTPTIGAVVSAFYDLSYQQQVSMETLLWNAGFYVDAEGDPLQTRPDFGSADPSNVNALSNALLQAYNANQSGNPKGQTLSSLTAGLIRSGAGAAQRQLAPSPVLGGGQTYQNLVTSPSDLYSQLYSTFESALGRAPTQDELNQFVDTFQSQQSQVQQAQNTQQETASMAKFRQQEAARNTELAFARTPAVAGSPTSTGVPAGPFNTPAGWATAFLGYAGFKQTASNIAFLLSVISKVGGWANVTETHNPAGSALPVAGAGQVTPPTGPSTNAPVTYQSWAAGMQATLNALQNFPNIIAVLTQGDASNPPKALGKALSADLSKWSNGKISAPLEPSAAQLKSAHAAAAVAAPLPKGTAPVPPAPGTAEPVTSPDDTGKVFGPPAAGFTGAPPVQPAPGAPGTKVGGKAVMGPPAAGFPGAPPTPNAPATPAPAPAPPTVPAADVSTGQNQYSSGDTYVGPSTVTGDQAPSAGALAFQQATTGQNAVPYMGNQYLNAFNVVANMIASGKAGGT